MLFLQFWHAGLHVLLLSAMDYSRSKAEAAFGVLNVLLYFSDMPDEHRRATEVTLASMQAVRCMSSLLCPVFQDQDEADWGKRFDCNCSSIQWLICEPLRCHRCINPRAVLIVLKAFKL